MVPAFAGTDLTMAGARLLFPRRDVEERALIGGALAEISIAVGAQHVDGAGEGFLVRPLPRHQHHAGQHLVADLENETHSAAVIEEAYLRAIVEPAALRLLRVQDAIRLALTPAQENDARIGGVGLGIAGRG